MITPVLAASAYVIYPVATMFVFVCLLLICVVLIQKPKGGGLSGAFGGGASSAQSAFGARTGDLLTWFTCGAFAVFLILSVVLTLVTRPERAGVSAKPAAAQLPSSPVPLEKPATTTQPAGGTSSGGASSNATPATQPANGEAKH